ncbi:MAG: DNA alkylation repair protein [Flavobacteriales bacterium]
MVKQIISDLKKIADPKYIAVHEHFGIKAKKALGLRIPQLRAYAKKYKNNHELALQLWQSDIHEVKILAIFIADPKQVTEELMEEWIKDFYSWDIVDGACASLFCKHPLAYIKAEEWTQREPEFEKRTGYSLMCYLAVHDKKAKDEKLSAFFPLIEWGADDERNFVKKAVNWALRQIGKRNYNLNQQAIACAERIKLQNSKSAKWIAADALRELRNEKIVERVKKKSKVC